MKTATWVMVTGLAAALLLVACGRDVDAGDGAASGATVAWDDLVGRTFVSTDVTQDGEPYPLVDGSAVRISFTDTGLSANAGCNTMGGAADLDDGVLVVPDGLATTEMACDPKLMDQDTWLADLLADRPAVTLDDDQLQLATDIITMQLLDDDTVNPDQALEGTTWFVTGMITGAGDDGAVSSVSRALDASIVLEDGQLRATAGCNRMHGSYVLDGDSLTVVDLASTKMACPGPEGELETHMKRVLDGTMTVTVDGSQLTLVNGDVGLLLAADESGSAG